MTITTQRKIEITGNDLSGTDGDPNRTYAIPYNNIVSDSLQIFANHQLIHPTSEYTLSGSTITFLVAIYNVHEIVIFFQTSSSATSSGLVYSSVLGFFKHLHMTSAIRSAGNGTESLELVGTGNGSNTVFFLDNIGVIEDTYTMYYGASANSVTALTETSDYALDLDTSKLTLTSAGVTTISADNIYAAYKYNTEGILSSEMSRVLKFAENQIERKTEQKFAEYGDDDPNYRKVLNEVHEGRWDSRWKTFDLGWSPVIDFTTTTSGAFTLGDTELTLVTGEGLPNSGTIYVGGNKVAYTARTDNVLTVPGTTPSIDDGSDVYGEVIEVSKESEGTTPSYTVLERDVDYKIDFVHGRIELLSNAYFGEFQNSDRFYPANYIVKASYFSAWYEPGSTPTIPDDIEECTYMIATNRLMKSTVGKAHITGKNGFNPSLIAVDRTDIDEIIDYYKPLNVGTSPFNKGSIS